MERWVICETGNEEGSGEPTHVIFELQPKAGIYSPVLQVFTLAYAYLILEALQWQESLHIGLQVDTKVPAKAPPKSKTPKRASGRA